MLNIELGILPNQHGVYSTETADKKANMEINFKNLGVDKF
jgi:hypothetical protein